MTLFDGVYVLEAVVAVSLWIWRWRWRRRQKKMEDRPSPFILPFSWSGLKLVEPGKEFFPGYSLRFGEGERPIVRVGQELNHDIRKLHSLHRRVLVISVDTAVAETSISVERVLIPAMEARSHRVRGSIIARASSAVTLVAELIIPQPEAPDKTCYLEYSSPTSEFSSMSFDETLAWDQFAVVDATRPVRLALFLPRVSGIVVEIGAFDVEIEPQ